MGDNIEPWRERLLEEITKTGVKITELSVSLGKDRDYISRVVHKGTGNPSPSLFLEICQLVGTSAGYILEGKKLSDNVSATIDAVLSTDAVTAERLDEIGQKISEGALQRPDD